MTAAEVQVRAEAARKFLEVARMVEDDTSDPALPRVASALAVLAGIAASDAVCGHVLHQRPQGQDHQEAVRVLGSIRGADELATSLRRLLADKTTSQYGTTYMTAQKAASMVRHAEKLVEGMEQQLWSR
ncbi:hypothetical protein MO973_40420 [Paenibacillus sp. TRM 82003]|uniref:hypothetical protein n=1 Tax=Kineococcus sp. TRM81007 TaxID=2925831 RepID=UPI001F5A98A9|nr:hypothetical protein [Kineococcus sp. TRM81007]MCI2237067.1 hypothetical protein [Kineococcus sp. TRM81007]MCI3926466.1 hypothetical protein [Paenibacillus sp. TRM 82003]